MKKFIVRPLNCGGYSFYPVDGKLQAKIDKHLEDFNIQPGSAYFQDFHHVQEFFGDKKVRQLQMLNRGWPIVIMMDTWEALHAWGWDTHTLAE